MTPTDNDAGPDWHQRLQTTEWWTRHFRRNRERDWMIPFRAAAAITATEHARIAASIAEFQRGESSEARRYLEKSELFSGRTGDPAFHAASILFVREENEHAALLLRFMQIASIPARPRVFSDGVFRRLRACSDLGWSSRVLLVAELVAQEYYPCLQLATRHPALVRICDKVIFDEDAHIRFQVERIVRVEAALGPFTLALRDRLQTALMLAAAGVVYATHRPVLAVRLSGLEFVRRVLQRNRAVIAALGRYRCASSFGIARDAANAPPPPVRPRDAGDFVGARPGDIAPGA